MMNSIDDIKQRIEKLEQLSGFNYCTSVSSLKKDATENEWIKAWNTDQQIIRGMMNDMELLCGSIEIKPSN